jgi:hypothetical protein
MVAVVRASWRRRCFSKPTPLRSWWVSGNARGACSANGEPGSVAQAHRSVKNVPTVTSQPCTVVLSSWPARRSARPRSIAAGTNARAWAGRIWAQDSTSG